MSELGAIEMKRSYASEVDRLLKVLGFSEQERFVGTLNTFSKWIDELSFDEERKATWIQLVIARFGTAETGDLRTIGQRAMDLVKMQQRFFPPRARTGLGDGPELESACHDPEPPWCEHVSAESDRWRNVLGVVSPEAMLDKYNTLLALNERLREWETTAKQRGWNSPGDMRGHSADDAENERKRWQDATGRDNPDDAKGRIDALISLDISRHKKTVELQAEIAGWQSETGCITATGAGALIASLHKQASERDSTIHKLRAKLDELSAKLSERDRDLLYASEEIDAIRNAAKVLGVAPDQLKELAKLRADFESKCREAQTERERADAAEDNVRTLKRVILEAREAAGIGDESDMMPLASWIEDARAKLTSAIIPLPKPEKVEPGQRWAFVMTAKESDIYKFVDASGCGYSAYPADIASAIYLGK